jgi:hypothetical protein
MSWDVKLMRPDGGPLGTVEAVKQAIHAKLPETHFYQESAGGKIASLAAPGVELPEALRKMIAKLPMVTKGKYGREDTVELLFYLGAGADLPFLHVSVKGDTDAAEQMLNALASSHGWSLSEYSSLDVRRFNRDDL